MNTTTSITKFQALQLEDQVLLNLLRITVRKILEWNVLLLTSITCNIITRAEQTSLFISKKLDYEWKNKEISYALYELECYF
jgi:hypothetical protein